MPPPAETAQFATTQTARLLERMAYQVNAAKQQPSPEAVHQLRVSIRRFTQALISFAEYFPRREVKKIRREIKRLMELAGRVRDTDIGLKLLQDSDAKETAAIREKLRVRRKEHAGRLVAALEGSFDPGLLRDEYRERVEKLIAAKRRGRRYAVKEAAPPRAASDLGSALRRSLRAARGGRRAAA